MANEEKLSDLTDREIERAISSFANPRSDYQLTTCGSCTTYAFSSEAVVVEDSEMNCRSIEGTT